MGDRSTLPGEGQRQRTTRGPRVATLIAALVALLAWAAPAMAAAGPGDDFASALSFNQTDPAGNEAPTTGIATYVKRIDFDNSTYTLEASEGSQTATNRTGCSVFASPAQFTFGGKSAWIRFVSSVTGHARFATLGAAGDDLLLRAEQTPDVRKIWTPGVNAEVGTLDCIDAQATPNETLDVTVTAGKPVYLQVLSRCAGPLPSPPTAASCQTAAVGGPTSSTLTFTPANADGDALPDTLDRCPSQFGTFADGCADSDGDGFDDGVDDCVAVRGVAPAGCPLPDTDGDGFLDIQDDCATIPGVAPRGCPLADTDGDKVPDVSDRCQRDAGPSALGGCPDDDRDGIPNIDDGCAKQAGGNATGGCPDRDGDRVADKSDRCLSVKGQPQRHGCPPAMPSSADFKYKAAATSQGVRLLSFRVLAPKGSRVVVRCVGRGCFKPVVVRRTAAAGSQLIGRVRRRSLRAGTRIEVNVSKAGMYGKQFRSVVRRGDIVDLADRCLPSAGLKRCYA
jgi:hypothetical protein